MARFAFEISARPGYLLVYQQGLARIEDLARLQEALLRAMARHRVRSLLFDNRDIEPPPEDVRCFMIDWLDAQEDIDAVAVVLRSQMIVVRTSMDALGKGVRRRGFTSMSEAIAWLGSLRKAR